MIDIPQPEWLPLFRKFGVSILLGFLIGVEREKEKGGLFAGIRTFSLIGLLGCLSAMLSESGNGWFFSVAFVVMSLFILFAYRANAAPEHHGTTTEIAALLTFLFGGMVWWNLMIPAVALTVVTVLLLASKEPLLRLTQKIAHQDLIAAIQFGVISAVVLPLLPDRALDPLGALNLYKTWLMVVLIAGFNLAAYAVIKAMGPRRGIGVMSLLGGLLSSTALTVTFSRRSKTQPAISREFAAGLCLADSLMFLRILAIVFVLNREIARLLLLPMAIGTAAGLLVYLTVRHFSRADSSAAPETVTLDVANPCELWPAVQFGLLFAAVMFLARGAQQAFGVTGVFVSSFAAGLASTDAITLSLANMAGGSAINAHTAAIGIVIAAASSMAAKSAIVALFGSRELKRTVIPAFLAILAAALAGVLFI